MKLNFLFAPLLWISTFHFGYSQKAYIEREIQKIIRLDDDIHLEGGTATVIGVIDGDSVYTIQRGTLSLDRNEAVTDTTLFPVGGVSQVHLILLTYHMMELGLISANDTVGRFHFAEYAGSRLNSLTISSLLAHTSGLPPILPSLVYLKKNSDDEYRYYDRHLIDSALVHWSSTHPMGGHQQISHYNNYILSKILWAVRDTRVHNNGIMIPEMRHTWFLSLDEINKQSIPSFFTTFQRPLPLPHFNGLTNAMGMVSCMEDLVILAKVWMRLCNRTDFQQAFLTPLPKKKKKHDTFTNGGFRIIDGEKSGNLYLFTGLFKGSSAYFCFAPKTHTAVIILHNAGTSQHVLGFHIMRMINYQFTRTY